MGCGKGHKTGHCVCNVLKQIARAQKNIKETGMDCDTSCEKSISDLLGETVSRRGRGLDTVPVLLYCEDGCKPFKGFGAHPRSIGKVVSSFFFRVKSVDSDCCAVLELLRDPNDSDKNPKCPTSQMTKHLRTTGICITVDLKCFCHVTCLPAISAF